MTSVRGLLSGCRAASLAVGIVAIFVALLVGAAMLPTIISSSNATSLGATGAMRSLLDLVPMIFVIILIVGGLMEIVGRMR